MAASTLGEDRGRVLQLVIGIICMVMIANLQYGWTYFVEPMSKAQHWTRPQIAGAFSLFVLTETWLVPVEGWFVDKFGPRFVVMAGGILVALAWWIDSIATSLTMLYAGAIISGIGAGAVYGTCVGNSLKWFVGKRGLAAGLTAAGFGAGTAATVVPIIYVIGHYGYQSAFLWFGLVQGFVILIASQLLKKPPVIATPHAGLVNAQSARSFAPLDMVRTPLFWLLYVMFALVATGGLIVTAQFASIAADFGVATASVSILGFIGTVLTAGSVLNNILNGLARPFFGWISDRIGREPTMFTVFLLNAAAIWSLWHFGHEPVLFVVCSGAIYFTWGEIYSLFPSTCTDAFGLKFATTNAGLLYTAKGTAALLVPVAALLAASPKDWQTVLLLGAGMNVVAALLAVVALRPLRRAHAIRNRA